MTLFLKNWNEEKSKKTYSHFDYRIDIRKAAEFIGNPQNIARYGFYPFIHYTMEMDRYNSKTGKDVKKREICYIIYIFFAHFKCFFRAFLSNSQFLLNFQRFFGIVLFVMTNACKMLNI